MATKPSLDKRIATDPKLRARVLANPGLRSKLSDAVLRKYAPKMAAKRQLNARLAQPITPGSSITERDLARESGAAMDVKYGDVQLREKQALQEEQNRQRDFTGPGGFYDQYLTQIARNAQNIRDINAAAANTGLASQRGITGVGNADFTQLQGQANQAAALQGVAPAGDMTKTASDAAAVRQALVGSFINQQAGMGAAQAAYADSLANIVGPQQKLAFAAEQAGQIRKAGDQATETAKKRGSDEIVYRTEKRADEANRVLAQQTLGANIAQNQAENTLEQNKIDAATQADKDKAAADEADKAAKDKKWAETPNQYGVPNGQWARWSTSHRQRWINENKGGSKKNGKGPEWVSKEAANRGATQVNQLKGLAQSAKTGAAFIKGHQGQPKLDKAGARKKIQEYAGKDLISPALLDAAVDAIYDRFLNASTVRALISAGYKPSEIAKTLGVPTSGQMKDGTTSYGGPH